MLTEYLQEEGVLYIAYQNTNYVPVAVNAPPENDSESDVPP